MLLIDLLARGAQRWIAATMAVAIVTIGIEAFWREPSEWAAGLTELEGGRTLVVSRGIGMERGRAPRLRFSCLPEVVFVDIVPP